MRPATRTLIAVPLAATALTLLAASPLRATPLGAVVPSPTPTGIVVGGGTVQPIDDPQGLFTFDVAFNPVIGETIQAGDSFTLTSSAPLMISLYNGSNEQPPGWSAAFSDLAGYSSLGIALYYSVKWTRISGPITSSGPLDPGPLYYFQALSPDYTSANFTYTFSDTLDGQHGNTGSGSLTIAVPEPATLVMVSFSTLAGLYLHRRSRRRLAGA
jgi:hypothetical protein